jgi:rubrerythrin
VLDLSELTLEKVLNTALMMEEGSIQLYTSAQDKVVNPSSKQFLKELVLEEQRHKENILEALRDPDKIEEIGSSDSKIQDLKIMNMLEEVSLSPEADYQQILIYAGKREKEAHDLYSNLAKTYESKPIGRTFKRLAQEELKHKLRLEKEYDDIILKEM